ncbi:large-conductance mechanosensitive channel [Brochothrix thermosphacta DSM 20171 = FSL F6-1036]|nr:large-conductance mechanosensitive channel [Brochothrix thermosphacta DSM 20171 = FSL F6-1036]
MWKEFKEFALKGNVLDLAVGVVIGGAFGLIVTSLVNDIIMPLVGIISGGVDVSKLSIMVGNANLAYGAFLQSIINFLIIAFSIFMFLKVANKLMRKREVEEEVVEEETKTELYLKEIAALLAEKKSLN